jgi:hypothetical protein
VQKIKKAKTDNDLIPDTEFFWIKK